MRLVTLRRRRYKSDLFNGRGAMSKPIFVLNGPNLNRLGAREPQIYGHETLEDIRLRCERRAEALGLKVEFRQSNREGDLVDWLNEAAEAACAVVINPAAYGHQSIALYDAIKAMDTPVVECHLSNPGAREAFRHVSMVSQAARGVISGFGAVGYELAIEAAAHLAGFAAKVAG
jgi:3-dehydroquinate dehydratase-2